MTYREKHWAESEDLDFCINSASWSQGKGQITPSLGLKFLICKIKSRCALLAQNSKCHGNWNSKPFIRSPVWHKKHPGLFSQHTQGLQRFNTVLSAMHLLTLSYDPNKVSKKEVPHWSRWEPLALSSLSRIKSASSRHPVRTAPNIAIDAATWNFRLLIRWFNSLAGDSQQDSIVLVAKPLHWMTATLLCVVGNCVYASVFLTRAHSSFGARNKSTSTLWVTFTKVTQRLLSNKNIRLHRAWG